MSIDYSNIESNAEECFGNESIWKNHLDTVEIETLDGICVNNFVLVEVEDFLHDRLLFSDEYNKNKSIYVDNSHLPFKYITRHGKVISLPEKLIYWYENKRIGIAWQTNLDIKVGDEVWYYGLMGHTAEKVTYQGRKFILINYEDLYVAKRGDEVIPLNGNVLLELLYKPVGGLSIKEREVDPYWAKVAYIGLKNTLYESSSKEDDDRIKKGAKVLISGIPLRKMEMEPFLDFDGKEYYICQNCEINGYLDDAEEP
ncbi:MAG TPA: hypothetical protein VGA80_06745 [Flavobacteriaceae bacterium]|jgi:co-chaperonin GroES (HSP10)